MLAVAFIVSWTPARAQPCGKPVRIEQRTYREFDEKLFVYVGDIRSSSGGWAPFTVRVLVGSYRRPFLASSGVLMEAGLDQLLSQRRDIKQERLVVPAFDPGRSRTKDFGKPLVVRVDDRSVTIRVANVVPVSGGSDHVFIEACAKR
jgi:hypothetical protein